MPTHREYALMSNIVYSLDSRLEISESDRQKAKVQYQELKKNGWQLDVTNKKFNIGDEYGYYAVTLINHQTKEIVIAHRGTIMHEKNFVTDIEILEGKLPKMCESASEYVNKIIDRINENNWGDYTLSNTGHSSGANTAIACAAKLAAENPTDAKAVVFELARGSRGIKSSRIAN